VDEFALEENTEREILRYRHNNIAGLNTSKISYKHTHTHVMKSFKACLTI